MQISPEIFFISKNTFWWSIRIIRSYFLLSVPIFFWPKRARKRIFTSIGARVLWNLMSTIPYVFPISSVSPAVVIVFKAA